jgi:hypothetical protein
MNIPEVRINFSHLLYTFASGDFAKSMNETMPSMDECLEWTANYRQEWVKYNQKLLTAMTEVLGVTFYKPVIDVSTAPFFMSQSDPLIINFVSMPDEFVDVLAHELLHVLLTDNNKVRVRDETTAIDLAKEWKKLFGEHDRSALNHIPVHAMLKYLYIDVLNDATRFDRDVKKASTLSNAASYVSAWKYVNDNDHKAIVTQLKDSYAAIA